MGSKYKIIERKPVTAGDLIAMLSEHDPSTPVVLHMGYASCPCCSAPVHSDRISLEPAEWWGLPGTGRYVRHEHPVGVQSNIRLGTEQR